MKVAVAIDNGRVAAHFGRCDSYYAFEVQGDEIKERNEIEHPGHKPGFLPRYLSEKGIDVIITGGIGPRAINMFNSFDIEVISGARGDPKERIGEYLKGELTKGAEPCEKHES